MSASEDDSLADEFTALISGYDADIQQMMRGIYQLIVDAYPELEARVVTGWQGVTFHHPAAKYVACLIASKTRVSLMFVHGCELEDADKILVDHGSQSAFMRFLPGDEIAPGLVVYYMLEAISLRA